MNTFEFDRYVLIWCGIFVGIGIGWFGGSLAPARGFKGMLVFLFWIGVCVGCRTWAPMLLVNTDMGL